MKEPTPMEGYWIVGAGRIGSLMMRAAHGHDRLLGVSVHHVDDLARVAAWEAPYAPTVGLPARFPLGCTVLLCVPDARIVQMAIQCAEHGASRLVHFSGAMGVELIHKASGISSLGALHPLMSVSSVTVPLAQANGVTFAVGTMGDADPCAREIVRWFGGDVIAVDDEKRPAWHLAATLASNGVYALIYAATRIATSRGIGADRLQRAFAQLALQSAESALANGVVDATTGPVVRGDATTVQKHVSVVDDAPDDRALYANLARVLLEIAETRGMRPHRAAAIRAVLASLGTPKNTH